MRVTLACVGRIRAPHAEADAHYRRMLRPLLSLEVVEAREEAELARRLPVEAHAVALHVEGTPRGSEQWARWLDERMLAAREVWLLIGGADGLSEPLLARCQERVSLGAPTLPHQLARVVVVEQLFRAAKIRAGEPYHR